MDTQLQYDLAQFVTEFVKNGCHHGCTKDECNFAGKQRMKAAESLALRMRAAGRNAIQNDSDGSSK